MILTYIPDKTFTRAVRPRNYVAKFGDGYEQRTSAGINSLDEELIAVFRTRPKAEIDALISAVAATRGVTSFTVTLPDGDVIRAVANDWAKIYEYDDFYTANITMRRVYDV